MYEQFYGFTRKPFNITPDPAFFFQNSGHNEAFSLLQYGLKERRGIFCLFGEVGTGKTMLLQRLLESLDDTVTAITLPYPKLSFEDVLDHILTELQIPAVSPKVTIRLSHLRSRLMAENAEGHTVALLVDEAQGMDIASLENLRLLSNLETSTEKLLQIILLGQPELKDKLDLESLRQFKQRVAISFELKPLLPEQTPQYIAHRLRVSGYAQGLKLFSDRALFLITSYSRGIPRLVNALCDNALLIGCALKQREIDEKIIREAAADLMLPIPGLQAPQTAPRTPTAERSPASRNQLSSPSAQPIFPAAVQKAPAPAPPMMAAQRRRSLFPRVAFGMFGVAFLIVFSAKVQSPKDIHSVLNRAYSFAKAFLESSEATGLQSPQSLAPKQQDSNAQAAPNESLGSSASVLSGQEFKPSGTGAPLETVEKQAAAPVSSPFPWKDTSQEVSPPNPQVKNESRLYASQDIEPAAPAIAPAKASHAQILPEASELQQNAASAEPGDLPDDNAVAGSLFSEPAGIGVGPQVAEAGLDGEPEELIKTVRKGENLSRIAKEAYGSAGVDILSFIQMTNPWIRDINLILEGQSLVLPPMKPERMIFDEADGRYTIYITATRDPAAAQECQNQLNRLEMRDLSVNVVPVWLTGGNRIYRLQAGGFHSKEIALASLKTILPSKYVGALREEIR